MKDDHERVYKDVWICMRDVPVDRRRELMEYLELAGSRPRNPVEEFGWKVLRKLPEDPNKKILIHPNEYFDVRGMIEILEHILEETGEDNCYQWKNPLDWFGWKIYQALYLREEQ
jgi:hypothetical protein